MFGRPQVLKILRKLVTLTKHWEINTVYDGEKTCGIPKEWELQTAHDRESNSKV